EWQTARTDGSNPVARGRRSCDNLMMTLSESSAEKELRDLLQSDAFSGVVAVAIEGRPLIEFAGGFANRRTGRPNTLQTRFATASVSKMFTAVCIGRLVDAGHCRFDQPLVDIVPALRRHFDRDLSLESLLSHQSGLGDYIDDDAELPFAGMDLDRLDCPEAFLAVRSSSAASSCGNVPLQFRRIHFVGT